VAHTKTATKPAKARQSTKAKSSKPSPKAKASSAKGRTTSRSKPARKQDVTIDRRRAGRRGEDQKAEAASPILAAPKLERRKKVNRRRQIDPTTCERDYTDDEIHFMNALDDYKRANGRMFPTCSEVLEVVRSLGYVRLSSAELATREKTSTPVERTSGPANAGQEAHAPYPSQKTTDG
jgi:hypothetical protein